MLNWFEFTDNLAIEFNWSVWTTCFVNYLVLDYTIIEYCLTCTGWIWQFLFTIDQRMHQIQFWWLQGAIFCGNKLLIYYLLGFWYHRWDLWYIVSDQDSYCQHLVMTMDVFFPALANAVILIPLFGFLLINFVD